MRLGIRVWRMVWGSNIRVNADGFGLAWYTRETIDADNYENVLEKAKDHGCLDSSILGLEPYMYESCTFKFISPAWSNKNLKNIGNHVHSSLIFAHVRAGFKWFEPR